MKKAVGSLMMGSLVVGLFVLIVHEHDIKLAIITFSILAVLIAWVAVAALLITAPKTS